MFEDLRGFLSCLEEEKELIRIGEELSPQYEIPAAIRHISRYKGAAVLFERVKGYPCPVVGNLLGSQRRLAMAFGVGEKDLLEAYRQARETLIKPQMVPHGPVNGVIIERDLDVLKTIPVLTHFKKDGGPYMTAAFVIARDPLTGIRGMGVHRIQIKDRDTVSSKLRAKADRQEGMAIVKQRQSRVA